MSATQDVIDSVRELVWDMVNHYKEQGYSKHEIRIAVSEALQCAPVRESIHDYITLKLQGDLD